MVGQVSLEVLWGAEFFPTGGVSALEYLRFLANGIYRDQTLSVLAMEALSGHLLVAEELIAIAVARVFVRALSFLDRLSFSEISLSPNAQ